MANPLYHRTEVTRRRLLKDAALLGVGATAGLGLLHSLTREPASERILSAGVDDRGGHHLSGFDRSGQVRFRFPIEGRGHGLSVHPTRSGEAVVIGRRPGRLAWQIDVAGGRAGARFECRPGRHFLGHACHSKDGSMLYTTENAYDEGRGVIGVRDARDFRWLGELPSHGVGPHELAMLTDGRSMVVANGGIPTHPDHPRKKLRLDAMAPSLVEIDVVSGALIAEHRLPDPHLSIRHLAVGADDRVVVAMQYEGDAARIPPLIALHRPGSPLRWIEDERFDWASLRGYTGSVALDGSSRIAGVTSPRGHRLTFWDTEDGVGRFLGERRMRDVCGIAWSEESAGFVVTTGAGLVYSLAGARPWSSDAEPVSLPSTRCDNHLGVAWA